MLNYTGWTIFTCGHRAFTKTSTKQELKTYYKREYLEYHHGKDDQSYYANAPRLCKKCCVSVMGKEPNGQAPPGADPYDNFEQKWRNEWAPKIASLEVPDTGKAPLKDLLHHICPHLRSVGNLKEEKILKRVNSQLQLEGLAISHQTTAADVDHGTKQRITRVVEDQLHMHRGANLKPPPVARDSLLQEADVAMRSGQAARVVDLGPRRKVMI